MSNWKYETMNEERKFLDEQRDYKLIS